MTKDVSSVLGCRVVEVNATARTGFALVGANGTYAVWDSVYGLRHGRMPSSLLAQRAVEFALANLDIMLAPPPLTPTSPDDCRTRMKQGSTND